MRHQTAAYILILILITAALAAATGYIAYWLDRLEQLA